MDYVARTEKREGVSRKTGKAYKLYVLVVETDYGDVEIVLDTKTSKAGIILAMDYDRKEGVKNG